MLILSLQVNWFIISWQVKAALDVLSEPGMLTESIAEPILPLGCSHECKSTSVKREHKF